MAIVQRERVEIAQAGETRAYLRRGNRLAQVTRGDRIDETTGYVVAPPTLVPAHTMARSLGVPVPIEPSYFPFDLRAGDTLLLCTRGLTAVLGDAEILGVLGRVPDPAAACKALVLAAVTARGEHNVTVVAAAPMAVAEERRDFGGYR